MYGASSISISIPWLIRSLAKLFLQIKNANKIRTEIDDILFQNIEWGTSIHSTAILFNFFIVVCSLVLKCKNAEEYAYFDKKNIYTVITATIITIYHNQQNNYSTN